MGTSTLPTPTGTADAAVRVEDTLIHLHHLVIDDEVAARLISRDVERGNPPDHALMRIVQVGARAIEQSSGALQIDYARAAFDAAAGEVASAFTQVTRDATTAMTTELTRLLDPTSGELPRILAAHATGLQQELARNFDATSATGVQHTLSEQVRQILEQSHQTLLTNLATGAPGSPLTRLQEAMTGLLAEQTRRQDDAARQLTNAMNAVRESLAEMRGAEQAATAGELALNAERERGTAKGFDFEDRVTAMLCGIAADLGDVCEDVSAVTGHARSKKGDAVIDIHDPIQSGTRLVAEMKTEQLTLRAAVSTLDGAMTARDATYALLIVSDADRLPKGTRSFQEIDADKLLVALSGTDEELDREILRLAVRYSRARAVVARGAAARMDAAVVQQAATAARSALATAGAIATSLNAAGRSIEQAKSSMQQMAEAVGAQLNLIEAAIEAAHVRRSPTHLTD